MNLRRRRHWVLLASVVLACQPPSPTVAPSPPPTPAQTVAPTPTQATPRPTPSAAAYLDWDNLPPAVLEDEDATSICDPEAEQFDGDAGETRVHCYAGSLFGLRALHTVVPSIDRIYLRRVRCAQTPCSATELNVITVTGWTDSTALSTTLDYEQDTVAAPVSDPLAPWPTPPPGESPEVERPNISGAPNVVRNRDPYPYCGDAPDGDSPIRVCFVAAVLEGRSVEMLDHNVVTGEVWIMRFDGHGLVHRYGESEAGWFHDAGSLILGVEPGLWSYDNWLGNLPLT